MALAVSGVVAARAQTPDLPPITIGVLTDRSGSSSDMAGQGPVEAVKLAVADAEGGLPSRPGC